jgi:hypothetical protein
MIGRAKLSDGLEHTEWFSKRPKRFLWLNRVTWVLGDQIGRQFFYNKYNYGCNYTCNWSKFLTFFFLRTKLCTTFDKNGLSHILDEFYTNSSVRLAWKLRIKWLLSFWPSWGIADHPEDEAGITTVNTRVARFFLGTRYQNKESHTKFGFV